MSVRLALALVFLAACTPRASPAPASEVPDSAAGGALADAAADENADAPADAGPAIDLPSDGGFAALFSGAVPARRLPERATSSGGEIDRQLRAELTTVEVPDRDAVGSPTPTGLVSANEISATKPVSGAARVVRANMPRARACYRLGLMNDPNMTGKLVITARVEASGAVSDATVAQNVGLSPSVAACLAQSFREATFAAPGGDGSTLTIPLVFTSGT